MGFYKIKDKCNSPGTLEQIKAEEKTVDMEIECWSVSCILISIQKRALTIII